MTAIMETNKIDFSDVLAVLNRLTEILQIETQMIKDMKLTQLHTLQDEKLKLTSVMESFKSTLMENPDILNAIPASTKSDLIKANQRFEKIVQEGGDELIKVRRIHGLVMEAIRKVLDDRRKKNSGYNMHGTIGDNSKKKILTSTPFKVNSNI